MEVPRKRKRNDPFLWDEHKAYLEKLYLHEKKTAKEIAKIMRKEYGFDTTEDALESRFKTWNFRKNLRISDWEYISDVFEKRKGRPALVYFNGHRIGDKKMKKELSRHVAASHAYTRVSRLGECPERVFVCTPASTELHSIRLDNLPWLQYQGALAPTFALELEGAYSFPFKHPNSTLGAPSPSLPSFGLGIEEEFGDIWSMDIEQPPTGNELQPRSDQSADLVKSDLMKVLMRKLETTLPEEYPGQFRMGWEDDSVSWGHTLEGRLLNLAIFLSSNNLMSRECDRFYDWLIDTLPTSLLVTLTSSKFLSTDACVVQLFRHALATQKADFARMLLDRRSDLNLVLISSSSFFEAALEKNDILNLKFLLEVKTRYNIDYDLPLYAARSREAVTLLLDAGVDVNMQYELPSSHFYFDPSFSAERLSVTALYCAIQSDNLDVFMALVEREADVNIVAKPIFVSNEWSDLEGLGITLLQQVIYRDDEAGEISCAMAKSLLRAGADINAISLSLSWRDTGMMILLMGITSPLETASRCGLKPWVELLVQSGAEIEQKFNGETMLEIAIRTGNEDIVRILLEKVGTLTGSSLMVAVEEENFEIVKALIEAGADCSTTVTNKFGLSIAQMAQAISDQPWILETLVEAGALRPSLPPTQAEKRAQVRRAIRKNDANSARQVLENGMDTTQDKEDWVDLLCQSIDSEEEEITRALLEAGVDANTSCPELYYWGGHSPATPLSWTLRFAPSKDVMSWILDAGGDPDANMWHGEIQSPIHFVVCCIRHRHCYFSIYEAVSVMSSILELLLIKGASVDAPGRLLRTEEVEIEYDYTFVMRTPLQEAFILGRDPEDHNDPFALIQRLLAAGANINYPALEDGATALQIAVGEAAKTGDLEMVEFLLERGADVNAAAANSGGRTALQFAAAAEQGNLILVERLLRAGANINAPAAEDKGITALQGASIRGHLKFAHIFLDGDANVNAPGSAINGRTALEGAAENGRLDMVQLLMNVGADSHLRGRKRYRTAEQFALKEGHLAVVQLLRSRFED
ncbi:Ankyrin repeat-containing domain protein [Hyaloscypha variabilis]